VIGVEGREEHVIHIAQPSILNVVAGKNLKHERGKGNA
jgi:hypothetical protein